MARTDERSLQQTPAELEFFAEDDELTVIPYFSLETDNSTFNSIAVSKAAAGDYGPFQPSFPVKVPLWLAVMLHKRKKCRIAPPDWMQSDHLQGVLEAERSTAAVFQPLPFRYLEVAHVLLNDAKDSFSAEEYYKVRDVLEQVRRVRSNKINAGLQLLVGPITVKLNNLSAMEINTIRPFFQGSLDRFYSLSQMEDLSSATSTQSAADSQSQPPAPQAPRQLRRAPP